MSVSAIDNRPSLYADLQLIWNAFIDLHGSRPSGFGPTAIPTSEVLSWLDLQGIRDRETRIEYYELIRVLDNCWLKWAGKENEKKDKAKNKKKKK